MPGKEMRDTPTQVAGLAEFGTLMGSMPVKVKDPPLGIRVGIW